MIVSNLEFTMVYFPLWEQSEMLFEIADKKVSPEMHVLKVLFGVVCMASVQSRAFMLSDSWLL